LQAKHVIIKCCRN